VKQHPENSKNHSRVKQESALLALRDVELAALGRHLVWPVLSFNAALRGAAKPEIPQGLSRRTGVSLVAPSIKTVDRVFAHRPQLVGRITHSFVLGGTRR
jgi:hypothetical protein